MASLISGFGYDIFISYRQKDNKHEGWVTEFVEHLKGELEATFKEDISIYFDENPHDGLLETHDVDESLKEKLKCLVFIPIISRTYCDPKSFAWEHEFKAFIDQASADQFGLKVKLPNGNVSSRVLPVRIHDLDITDVKLCESILNGAIRSIDFVYKEPGVNRPLTREDDEEKNLNRTRYKNQINKTANAIREIISGLRSEPVASEVATALSSESWTDSGEDSKRRLKSSGKIFSGKSLRRLIVLLLVILGFAVTYEIYRIISLSAVSKTIAVIPLTYPGNDTILKDFGDIYTEAIHDKLTEIKNITVRSRLSALQYRNTGKTLQTIRKELGINYLVGGNIRRDGDKVIVWINLVSARRDKNLWSGEYEWDKDRIPRSVQEIIKAIIYNLGSKLSPEELKQVESEPTQNSEANLNFRLANSISYDAWSSFTMGKKLMSYTSFTSAVIAYSKAIEKDTLFARAYANRAIARSWGYYSGELDSTHIEECRKDAEKALLINGELPEARTAMGFYHYYCKNEFDRALEQFSIAAELSPDDYQPLFHMAMVYRRKGDWLKSQELIRKVIKYDPQEALYLTNIGLSYSYLHDYDSALLFHQKAIDMMPSWSTPYIHKIYALIFKNGNTNGVKNVLDSAVAKSGNEFPELSIQLDIYERKYTYALKKTDKLTVSDVRFKGKKYLYKALIYKYLKDSSNAIAYFDSALVSLNNDLQEGFKDPEFHVSCAIANAGLGNKLSAITEGERALDLSENDKLYQNIIIVSIAQVYTMAGSFDNAINALEYLLMNPSWFSVKLLKLDPAWEPLANIPAFQTLINKYSAI